MTLAKPLAKVLDLILFGLCVSTDWSDDVSTDAGKRKAFCSRVAFYCLKNACSHAPNGMFGPRWDGSLEWSTSPAARSCPAPWPWPLIIGSIWRADVPEERGFAL